MVNRELHDKIHKILHEFQGTTCRTDGGWCDARDHTDVIVALLTAEPATTPTHVCGKCEHAIVPWGNTCPRCGSGVALIRVKEWAVPSVTQAIVEAALQKAKLFVHVPHNEQDLKHPDQSKPCENGHEWTNQFGEDWTPDVGTYCDCRKKRWGISL